MSIRSIAQTVARRLPAPLYRLVREVRVRQLIRGYHERVIVRSYGHGVRLKVSLQDPLAEGWYGSGHAHDLPEIAASRDHGLEPGARVFDLGAHQAVIALILADIVGPAGHVIAVEAQRHNARVAQRNVELNDARNVTVLQAACSSTSGTVVFQEGLNGQIATGRLGMRRTRAVTIDELADLFGAPDVVYIDIEGYEAAALDGASRALAAGATFVIEVHASGQLQATGETVAGLLRRFESYVYDQLYRVTDEQSPSGTPPLRLLTEANCPSDERFFLLAASTRKNGKT